jgi:hypothetical protein
MPTFTFLLTVKGVQAFTVKVTEPLPLAPATALTVAVVPVPEAGVRLPEAVQVTGAVAVFRRVNVLADVHTVKGPSSIIPALTAPEIALQAFNVPAPNSLLLPLV